MKRDSAHSKQGKRFWAGWLLGLLMILMGWQAVQAQEKSLYWQRYDVNLAIQANGDILVEEIQQIAFTGGTFQSGFAVIPLGRVEQINDVTVAEVIDGSEQSYTRGTGAPYSFETTRSASELEINWYFPETGNSEHTYILRYRVSGGLRIYGNGDQLWWKAIPPDHGFPIRTARMTVSLPGEWIEEQLIVAAYGAPSENFVEENRVIFRAADIPASSELEVRVQFPHGIVPGSPPAWQAAVDREEFWQARLPIFGSGLVLTLLIGGPAGVYFLWRRQQEQIVRSLPGRVQGPKYLAAPPSDLPAGIIGTLLDEYFGQKEIVASLVDLARRGALRIEEIVSPATDQPAKPKFIIYEEDTGKAAYPYEKTILKSMFGASPQVRLSDLSSHLYASIPYLRTQLDKELIRLGLFNSASEKNTSKWNVLGCGGIILAVVLIFAAGILANSFTFWVILTGAALLPTIVVSFWLSHHTPKYSRLTLQGAEEKAKWRAFKRYLTAIEQHSDLATVKEKFEAFLPYAVTFGLEQDLIEKFATVDAPAPAWWKSASPAQPDDKDRAKTKPAGQIDPRPAPSAGSPTAEEISLPSLTEINETVGTSLTGASQTIGNTLASMSNSLGVMLNSASSTLARAPVNYGGSGGGGSRSWGSSSSSSSSSRSSSSSWSGGSKGGGGGSGGGSRGFR